MNKLTLAVLTLVLAAMGGCATNGGGDLLGTGVMDGSNPFPQSAEVQADG